MPRENPLRDLSREWRAEARPTETVKVAAEFGEIICWPKSAKLPRMEYVGMTFQDIANHLGTGILHDFRERRAGFGRRTLSAMLQLALEEADQAQHPVARHVQRVQQALVQFVLATRCHGPQAV